MGYGKRALKLLKNYYAGQFASLDEDDSEDEEESDNGKNWRSDSLFSPGIIFFLNRF